MPGDGSDGDDNTPRSAVSQILSETVAWDSADYNMGALTSSNPGNPVINAAAAAERRARLSITSDGDGARDSVGSYSSRASSVFAEQDAAAGLDSPDAPQVPLSRTVPGRMGSLLSGSSSRASPLDGSEGQGPQRSRSRLSRESDSSPLSAMALPRIRVTGAGARAAAALPAALGAKAAALAARLPSAGGSSGASSSLAAMLPSVPDAAPSEPAAPAPTSAAAPSAAAPGATGAADADQGVMRERQQSREKVGSWIASNASMGDGVAEVDAEGVPDLSAAAEASGESTEAIDAAYDAGGNTDMREAAVVRAPCGVRELGARWLAHAAARELSLAAGARVWAPGEWASVTAGADGSEADVGAVFERTVSFVQPISSPFVKVDSTRVEVTQRVQVLPARSPAFQSRAGASTEGEVLVVVERAHSRDVPQGDAFRTVTTLVAAPAGGSECEVRVRTGVEEVGAGLSGLVGGVIRTRARDDAADAARKSLRVLCARAREARGGPRERDHAVAGAGGASLEYADGEDADDEGGMDAQCMRYAGNKPPLLNPANVSNMLTFVLMVVGLVMRLAVLDVDEWDTASATPWRYVLAFGLMGFAGGVTNELAIKMLFDHVGFEEGWSLPGSGIIPKQFEGIRDTVKRMIVETFFDRAFLERELRSLLARYAGAEAIEVQLRALLESDEFVEVMDRRMADLAVDPNAGKAKKIITTFGVGGKQLRALTRAFLPEIAGEVSVAIGDTMGGGGEEGGEKEGALSPDRIAATVERLVDARLQELTAQRVKTLVEAVMKANLGWLVVWGNIFGGLIGVISEAAGY